MAAKVLESNEDHFVVDNGDGKPFKVHKRLLKSKHLIAKMEAMHQLCVGGKVKGYADGDEVPAPDEDNGLPPAAPPTTSAEGAVALPDVDYSKGVGEKSEDPIETARRSSEEAKKSNEKNFGKPRDFFAKYEPSGQIDELTGEEIPGKQTNNLDNAKPPPVVPPEQHLGKVGVEDNKGEGSASQAQPLPTNPNTPLQISGGGGGGGQSVGQNQLDQANSQAIQAAGAKANADIALGAANTNTLVDQAGKMAAIEADRKQRIADIDAEMKPIQRDVMNGKIDPQRLWHDSSTVAKIGAYIGIALGGISQGLFRGGPNQAVESINGMISRDIDAQKANLSHKANLLSYFMGQKHDVDASAARAQILMQDQIANQLKLNIAIATPGQAKANLQATLAGLMQDNVQKKAALATAEANTSKTRAETATLRQGLMQTQGVQAVRQQIDSQLQKDGSIPAGWVNSPVLQRAGYDPKEFAQDPNDPGRYLKVSGGADQAKLLSGALAETKPVIDAIDSLGEAAKKISLATKLGDKVRASAAAEAVKGKAEILRAQLPGLIAAGKQTGNVRLTEQAQKLSEMLLGDPLAIGRNPEVFQEQLRGLDEHFKGKLEGMYSANVPGYRSRAKKVIPEVEVKKP